MAVEGGPVRAGEMGSVLSICGGGGVGGGGCCFVNDTATTEIYTDVPQHLHPAAARNVLAHLIDLTERGVLDLPEGRLEEAVFRKA